MLRSVAWYGPYIHPTVFRFFQFYYLPWQSAYINMRWPSQRLTWTPLDFFSFFLSPFFLSRHLRLKLSFPSLPFILILIRFSLPLLTSRSLIPLPLLQTDLLLAYCPVPRLDLLFLTPNNLNLDNAKEKHSLLYY